MKIDIKYVKRTMGVAVTSCFFAVSICIGQDSTDNVMDVVDRHMDSHRYLEALLETREYPVSPEFPNSLEVQMQLMFSSFLGQNRYYSELIEAWEDNLKLSDSLRNMVLGSAYQDDEAIGKMIELAKDKQIVMVNEMHFYPHHRLLAMDLLTRLRALGYTYFALETLAEGQDTVLNEADAFPRLGTGYYTREQNFSNLIRLAKQLDFRFVAYENTDPDKDREEGEADNLYRGTFAADPSAKVFVFAGGSHIMERPDGNGKKWMATIFKERYGIDPLTIDQFSLNAYRHDISGNYALMERKQFGNQEKLASTDLQVVSNRHYTGAWDGKEEYRNDTNQEIQVALFYYSELGEKLEVDSLIPYFTALLLPGEQLQLPYLLSEGAYLVVYDGEGHTLERKHIGKVKLRGNFF